MSAIAIIPARGGSKGVPRKNIRKVGGKTLIRRCVETCNLAGCFDSVVVSTDCEEIRREAYEAGAELVERPPWLATDKCLSDPVLLHALTEYMRLHERLPDVTAFVQCTAPLMTAEDVAGCVKQHASRRPDVTIQVVESHCYQIRFVDGPRVWEGVGFDIDNPCTRRQDRPPQYAIAGTIWAMDTLRFIERGKVYSNNASLHVTKTRKLDIDTEADLRMAELLLSQGTEKPDVPVPEWYEYVGLE